jgi:recombinational DNA repair ATPase RecF
MLESLNLKNFTAFGEADFQFSPGLNVIVGENGTGKTHILKLSYCVLHGMTSARSTPCRRS